MSGKVKVVNKLPQFVQEREHLAARAITQALVLGSAEASVMTPIDISTLLNSQYCEVRAEGGKVIGTAGYTARYALPVHDPKHKQTFRRSTAEKEFLTKGFEKAKPNIDAVMAKTLKA